MIDYLEEVKKIISQQFNLEPDTIEEESFFSTDLNISELDLEDIIAEIEDKFQIEIPQTAYSKFNQLSDLVNYLYENADQV